MVKIVSGGFMESASEIIKRLNNKAKSTDDSNKARTNKAKSTDDLDKDQEDKLQETKPRSKSFSSLPPLRSHYVRESYDPKPTAEQLDKSLTLLKKNKRWEDFNRCVNLHLAQDSQLNEEITTDCNYLAIDKDFLLALKRKVEARDLSNPLQQAARVFVDILWEDYLRPACEKLRFSANSPQIDFIIQAILNEFNASNLGESKNAVEKLINTSLDSQKLYDNFKNQFDYEKYRAQLKIMRNMLRQALIQSMKISNKSQVTVEIKIENFKVPNKGNFISETLFIKKFAEFLDLDKKDLKDIVPVIFQSIRSSAKKGENGTLIHDLKETQPIYFKDGSDLFGLFVAIKSAFKNISNKQVKNENNKELIKAINRQIKNNQTIVENAIISSITNWLKGLIQHNKKTNPEKTESSKKAPEEIQGPSP